MSLPDRQVRIFKFLNGKVFRKYDESLQTITEMQQAGTSIRKLDDMEFGRRLAVDKELEKSPQAQYINAVFDESGHFIIYPSLLGIKGKLISLYFRCMPSTQFLNTSRI
jgi:peptidylprolyl isomerase domain and WD repeat-containing protein 1